MPTTHAQKHPHGKEMGLFSHTSLLCPFHSSLLKKHAMALSHAGVSVMRSMANGSADNPAFRPIMQVINVKQVGGQDRFRVSNDDNDDNDDNDNNNHNND